MDVKSIGAASMKAGSAVDSLARTDDMLAIIGIIMLLGVVVSSYGAFWQGRLAKAQFNYECNKPTEEQNEEADKRKTTAYIITVSVVTATFLALIIYVFRKQFFKPKTT